MRLISLSVIPTGLILSSVIPSDCGNKMKKTKTACVGYVLIVCLICYSLHLAGVDVIISPADYMVATSLIRNLTKYNASISSRCIPTSTVPSFIICTHAPGQDIYVSEQLQSSGLWEPNMTKLFQSILKAVPNSTFVDIGAHVGYFGLLASIMGHRTISVEPFRPNVNKLEEAVVINNVQDRIVILNAAVSNARKWSRLELSSNNQGGHRLLAPSEFSESQNVTLVRSICLDDVTSLITSRDVILKIDVEGHECRVMERSHKLFSAHRVAYILTEWGRMRRSRGIYGVSCPAKSIQSLADMLSGRGYRAVAIGTWESLDISDITRWPHDDVYWVHPDWAGVYSLSDHS